MNSENNRIWFLQLARAFACLLIVYTHWITFIFNPNEVFKMIKLNPLNHYPAIPIIPRLLGCIEYYYPSDFRDGFFALALFFLISGFVIPYSMKKISPIEFLFRRIMRVYPAVVICVLTTGLLITLGREIVDHSGLIITLKEIIGNSLLMIRRFHVSYIEHGLWTLEVEIRFYILCFFLAFFNGQRKAVILLLMPFVIGLVMGKANAAFISISLIGTAIFNWFETNWSGKKTCLVIAILMMINRYYVGKHFHDNHLASIIFANHVYGIFLFVMLLLLNKKLPYSVILDKIADSSYSLYLMHGTSAYLIYFFAYHFCGNVTLSIFATLTWIITVTLLMYRYIERPSITFSKEIVKYFKARKSYKEIAYQHNEA